MSDDGLHANYAERELDDEPTCPRCEVPQSWCVCLPIVTCPQCGDESEDMIGFGLLFCEECGWCVHAAVTNGRCERCRRRVECDAA